MTNKNRPRHAAPSKAGRIAGRVAVGAIGAPLAMFAAAGPAGAAPLADDGADNATGDFSQGTFDAPALGGALSSLFGAQEVPDLPGPATVTDLLTQLTDANPLPTKLSPAAFDRFADTHGDHEFSDSDDSDDEGFSDSDDSDDEDFSDSDDSDDEDFSDSDDSDDEDFSDSDDDDDDDNVSASNDDDSDDDSGSGSDDSGSTDSNSGGSNSGGSDDSGSSSSSDSGSSSNGGLVGDLLSPLF